MRHYPVGDEVVGAGNGDVPHLLDAVVLNRYDAIEGDVFIII